MRVGITDFQSLGKVVLAVEGFTVIVGPSNRGKSALIRAIEGALFNRPGDQFVRKGARDAEVILESAPTSDGKVVLDLQWRKGKSKTRYIVGGFDEPFLKVGQGVPPPVIEAGYRDLWVGDKERKNGEAIRPQVARQFDRIFLLDRPGSFVAEVLGTISRHSVLLTAQGRAAGDERTTKQHLGVRQSDLVTAMAERDVLAEVPALAARVEQLVQQERVLVERKTRLARVRALVHTRRILRTFLDGAVLLPAVTVPPSLGVREAALATLVDRRRRWAPIVALPRVAPAPPVPAALGVSLAAARHLLTVRQGLQRVSQLPLPPAVVLPADLDARAGRLRSLVLWRQRLIQVTALLPTSLLSPVPPEYWPRLSHLEELTARLRLFVQSRRAALDRLFAAEQSASAASGEAEQVQGEYELALQELGVCPLCDQAMPHAAHQ